MRSQQAIDALGALAQESRLGVFKLLVRAGASEMPAGEIARDLGVPASTMSTHLAILERAGLIQSRREGRTIYYRADLDGMTDLMAFLIEDCCDGRAEAPLRKLFSAACEGAQEKPPEGMMEAHTRGATMSSSFAGRLRGHGGGLDALAGKFRATAPLSQGSASACCTC